MPDRALGIKVDRSRRAAPTPAQRPGLTTTRKRSPLGRMLRSEATLMSAPWLTWLALFYAVPLGFVLVISFWHTEGSTMVAGFSFDNYRAIFEGGSENVKVLVTTLLMAGVVLALSALVAYPMAYFLAFRVNSMRTKAAILTLISLPFLVGGLIRTVAWRGVLGVQGVVNELLQTVGITHAPVDWLLYSKFAVALALFYNFYPFMLFTIYLVFESLDRRLVAAALDLGASRWKAFSQIIFPLSVPGLLTGSILIFVPVASASLEPEILGGPSGRFVANVVQAKFFTAFDWPAGAAFAVVFALASVLILGALSLVLGTRYRRVFAGITR
jgi:spermidine/putrescine transport system permease protein